MELLPNPLVLPAGILIGILVAAPIGPVNVLCIQRCIERGVWAGIAAGLGAVLADALVALAAALGVGAITGTFDRYRLLIETAGGIVLIATGTRLFFLSAPTISSQFGQQTWPGIREIFLDMPRSFLLTITNPASVLGLIAIFGGVSTFVEVNSNADALAMVVAIVLGSILWWIFLSVLVSRVRHRFDATSIGRVNRVSGLLLFGFGILLLGEVALMSMRPA